MTVLNDLLPPLKPWGLANATPSICPQVLRSCIHPRKEIDWERPAKQRREKKLLSVLNVDQCVNGVKLATNASPHVKPEEWMGELDEPDGQDNWPYETFWPSFSTGCWDRASFYVLNHVTVCVCEFVSVTAYVPCVSPHLQGSWRRKLGHRRLPNARVNYCPHQMPVQQDIHLHRVSTAS